MFDRCVDRADWTRRVLVLPQPRMQLIELPHLSIGSPSEIAMPRVFEVETCKLLQAARGVKAGSQLVGERFVVDETICACRRDGLFVKALGIELPPFDPRDLGADQCRTILEVLRAVRRPSPELPVMRCERLSMPIIRVEAHWFAACGASERGIEMIIRPLQQEDRQRR